MSESAAVPAKHDPFVALRQVSFVFYTASRVLSVLAMTFLSAVVGYHVRDLSPSASSAALNLGLLGLVRFFPSLGMSLVGGSVADVYNRRNVIIIAEIVPLAAGVVLAAATLGGWIHMEVIFATALFMGLASAFEGPARQALLPAIVRPETFANAVTVGTTLQSLGMVSGYALGGVGLYAIGIGASYAVYAGVIAGSMLLLLPLRYREQVGGPRRTVSLTAIKEGIQFVRQRQAILGAMSLDLFAVIFGGATALLPVYARDILHSGKIGYGILTASLDSGAFLMSLVLVMRPPIVKTGKALVFAVVVYGAFTVAYGFSRVFVLSVFFYAALGAADQVSVVMRQTTIQLATPDALRGRVSAVNQVFIGASNQVGAMESGFLAALTSATFSVVSGGFIAVGVASFVGLRLKGLYNYTTTAAIAGLAAAGAAASAAVTGDPATAGGGSVTTPPQPEETTSGA